MADVQFEGEQQLNTFRSRQILGNSTTPRMIKWLIDLGIVKTEKAAGVILFAIIIICFTVAIYFFFFTGTSSSTTKKLPFPPTVSRNV